jgi:hypothetical protein
MAAAPLYVGSLIGWRTWQLETDQAILRLDPWAVSAPAGTAQPQGASEDGQFRLVTGQATEWPSRERLVAHCRVGRDHSAPKLNCTCGIYAARSHRILRSRGYAAGPDDRYAPDIVGEVWMWGRVMESSEILRAEFAYPKRLFVPHLRWRWAKPLTHTYDIPVEVCNPFTLEVT